VNAHAVNALGRYFWFICFGVVLVNVLIWRGRVHRLVDMKRITDEEGASFLRAITLGLAAPCLVLGLIALRAHYDSPSCIGPLNFQDAAGAVSSVILIGWWLAILRWVWIGQGAVLLSRIVPVLWNFPSWTTTYSPKVVRLGLTAVLVIAALTSVASRSTASEHGCRGAHAAA
jgi:hypothetical protein